jgi:hypothetical protein
MVKRNISFWKKLKNNKDKKIDNEFIDIEIKRLERMYNKQRAKQKG